MINIIIIEFRFTWLMSKVNSFYFYGCNYISVFEELFLAMYNMFKISQSSSLVLWKPNNMSRDFKALK